MGLTVAKEAPTKKASTTVKPKAPLAHCDECPLKDRTPVFGEGPERAVLVIVGEGPGSSEERAGRPFVGRSGKLLRAICANKNVDLRRVYVTNATICYSPTSNAKVVNQAMKACNDRLRAEVKSRNPKAVLALGAVAMHALGRPGSITKLRGTWSEVEL